ncbi:crotonase/enoyl-CoA hydratase family protein [Alloalcanivorax mobilis]|uniref:crotonase/enoyl-CoA hydratase family protein n=1 Tax=Alloalcanivorax mobilis TaxID=2019569 RepID=UPI000B5B492F|nr:crotonase/enoyl-CoA hydratase family protein [Alloalcanivorax mobilis]ASK34941.1 enoyl-CoA hydratase [Alcanivorax sp. N3-2A]|tara:strand:+ start:12979 stop:13797 length:819 start_codon:yes stop_codon:yes gene_type:complete
MKPQTARDRVTLSIEDHIATVTLNRPDKYNGLDLETLQALVRTAKALRKNRDVRVVILRGEGKAFCAGLDFATVTRTPLKMLLAFTKFGVRKTNLFQQACWAWRQLPVPVIAELHGYCYGGGLQLALAADFRIASPECELSVMEIKWGLIPDMTGTATLRELLPMDVAKELAMTGRRFDAREALSLHLVTRVAEDPHAEALTLAQALLERSPDAVSASKALFQRTWHQAEDQAFAEESRLQFTLLRGRNQREAMSANLKKRAPVFRARQREY